MEPTPTKFDNPYKPFEPARGGSFVGRGGIIRIFRRRIGLEPVAGAGDKRHLLLVGAGGIGKTSVLLRLQHEFERIYPRLKKRSICLDVGNYSSDAAGLLEDLREALPRPRARRGKIMTLFGLSPTASVEDLGKKLAEDFLESVSLTFPVPGWEITPGLLLRQRLAREGMAKHLARVFKEVSLLTSEDGEPLLILIDQVGKAMDIPGAHQLIHSLCSLMEASVRAGNVNLLLVLAVRPERKGQLEHDFRTEIFDSDFLQRLPMYPLTQDEAREAIERPAQEAGGHLSKQLVTDIVESAGGHPYFLQIACSHLWEYLVATQKIQEKPIQVDTATVVDIVRRGQAKLFEDFNSDEQYLLRLLARKPGPLNAMEIKEMVKTNGKAGFIDVDATLRSLLRHKHRPITARREQDDYTFNHDLFRDYIRQHELSADEREVAALQALLDGVVQASALPERRLDTMLLVPDVLDRSWQHRDRLRIARRHLELLALSDLRYRLVEELTWAVSPEALDHLCATLNHPNAGLRMAAAAALERIHDARSTRALIEVLRTADDELRKRATRAVTQIGEAAVGPLIEALQDGDRELKLGAAQALGEIGDARAVQPLIELLRHGDSDGLREAGHALGKMGKAAADLLLEALRDENGKVRREAARALGDIGDGRATEALTEVLQDDEDSDVREGAARALGEIGDGRAVQPLIKALRDQGSDVRRGAAEALGNIGDAQAAQPLIDALRDKDSEVHIAAVEAVGQMGEPAVELLIQALLDDDNEVRWGAVCALGEIGDARTVDALIEALVDEDALVGEEAMRALSVIGEAAVYGLIEALGDENGKVRREAARALGEIRATAALDALAEALVDSDPSVRDAARQALESIKPYET